MEEISIKRRPTLLSRLTNLLRPNPKSPQTILVKLHTIKQFFNTFDPSPFHQRDLDLDAEEFILTAAREIYLLNSGVRDFIIFVTLADLPSTQEYSELFASRAIRKQYLVQDVRASLQIDLQKAIHHHFTFQAKKVKNSIRMTLRNGQVSLLVGFACLCICLILSNLLQAIQTSSSDAPFSDSTWISIASNALQILAWVSLWRPVEGFVFSWWPLAEELKCLEALARAKLELECINRPAVRQGSLK